ncbi:glycosyltransferase [Polluticaenibacter yanchengensis]|uniref:Glycosyltransferase n=1 Tax=Polluticaenibacter yanchengensis TaxID=3014562 RepID=A0ABT4UP03_9BACT|nr:glycosyltransferase [Chitinophagaceae bacterium LY-5]
MVNILVIGLVWPEPTSSAAGWRMLQILESLQLIPDSHITFASAAAKSPYSFRLDTIQIEEKAIELNNPSFDDFIQLLQPDIVVYDRFVTEEQFGWRVHENCPRALTILDTEDLHFLRQARTIAVKKQTAADYYNEFTIREISSILRCDLSVMISTFEIDLLVSQFNIQKDALIYLPFLEENITNDISDKWKTFEERQHFTFIGNFLHEPNYQAVLQLKLEIWPQLKKLLPNSELHIYGAYAHHKALQLHNPKERFFIKGRCDNARQTISNYKLLLAPIHFGAGVKGKFIDAMQTGTPSVTTETGAESMHENLNWPGYIAADSSSFISETIALYNNKSLWINAQNNCQPIINTLYSKQLFQSGFIEAVSQCLKDLDKFRNQHFIREILLSNTNQAKKYMSLWIEAKNK